LFSLRHSWVDAFHGHAHIFPDACSGPRVGATLPLSSIRQPGRPTPFSCCFCSTISTCRCCYLVGMWTISKAVGVLTSQATAVVFIIDDLLRFHHFHEFQFAILLYKLISTHVPTTDSDHQLSIYNLGQNLFGSKQVLTNAKSLDWKHQLVKVEMISEQFIDGVTFDSLIKLYFLHLAEILFQLTVLLFEISPLLIDISQVLQHRMYSFSVFAIDFNHVIHVHWFFGRMR
jgi:hypothetical protein